MDIQNDFDFLIISQQFPRLGKGLEVRWGTVDFEPYIMALLSDTREHTRQGFPKNVHESLTRILLTHHNLFPGKRVKSKDIWDSTFGDLA
jgi:hypothetical protein